MAKGDVVASPVTKTPCLAYKVDIEDMEAGEGGDSSRKDTWAKWFFLDDGTGRVIVDAHDAEFDLRKRGECEIGTGSIGFGSGSIAFRFPASRNNPDDEHRVLNTYVSSLGLNPLCGKYKLVEYCLLPNQNYFVAGTCWELDNRTSRVTKFCPKCKVEYRPDFTQCIGCHVALVEHGLSQRAIEKIIQRKEATNEASGPVQKMIAKGEDNTLIISWQEEKEVESSLRKRAALQILAGAALSTVCLALFFWAN